MLLSDLMHGLPLQQLVDGDARIDSLEVDSRAVAPGSLFFAREGWFIDSHQFIPQALQAGASALVVTRLDSVPTGCPVPVYLSTHEDRDLGLMADRFFASPTMDLLVFGITGTNGKTSVAWMLSHLLEVLGERPAIIGTVGHSFNGVTEPARNTTPDGLFIHRFARRCLDAGATALVMEVSSHGIELQRIAGVAFDVVGFTNLTPDHIDFHKTFDAYREAKTRLFTQVSAYSEERGKKVTRVINVTSSEGRRLADRIEKHGDTLMKVGVSDQHDETMSVMISEYHSRDFSIIASLSTPEVTASLQVGMPGLHNAENSAVALGMCRAVRASWADAVPSLRSYRGVRGRIERIGGSATQAPAVFVDYAHTPDAVARVVDVIRESTDASQAVILLGAGGDRDSAKRPEMLRAALASGGRVIVTSDNPRSEDARSIADAMCAGVGASDMTRVQIQLDRSEAIVAAIHGAPAGGVWILGKGHERYQEVAGRRWHFDDAQWARWALWSLNHERALADVPFISGWSLTDLADAFGGRVLNPNERAFSRWFTDTRAPIADGIFVALRGDRFDGHDFVASAVAGGAAVVVVERPVDVPTGVGVVVVENALDALQRAAARVLHERRNMAGGFRTWAITGSNGKTTTKELLASLLRASGQRVLATPGNWNNDIGLPLTVGELRVGDDAAVLEMGAGQPGDIARLAQIGQQDVAVITSIGYAHTERLGGLDGVRKEKLGIVSTSRPPIAVIPSSDAAELVGMLGATPVRRLVVAGGPDGPLRVQQVDDATGPGVVVRSADGVLDARFDFPLRGAHNLDNFCTALTAMAVRTGEEFCWPLPATISEALARLSVPGGRQHAQSVGGRVLVDDAYNANPSSVAAALNLLLTYDSPRWVVLGDMEELGPLSESLHRDVGVKAAAVADRVVAVGVRSRATCEGAGAAGIHFDDWQSACAWVAEHAPEDATLWVKGSRAGGLERLVAALKRAWE